MECDQVRRVLDAFVDGELDVLRSMEVEEHLRACPACAGIVESQRALAQSFQEKLPRHSAPGALKTRIQALLREEAGNKVPWWKGPSLIRPWAVAFLMLVVASASAFFVGGSNRSGKLAEEAVSNHIRSLQAGHLMDVASTDQHTVKPWFAGRLDFSPIVVDLAESGFPLLGGRQDVLDHQSVAALVYQRRKHFINLFVWPGGNVPAAFRSLRGYQIEEWSRSGMNYLAVSDLAEAEFREFSALIRKQTN
ncbi:MAG: anti-sigma factor [Methylacidiphilales bacterium]|nr:anti-sigma factor [Candidatus Methylacidiphilales bacterium]